MQFEWDDDKDEINKKKHGISFEDAVLVFADPMAIEYYDGNHSEGEIRFRAFRFKS